MVAEAGSRTMVTGGAGFIGSNLVDRLLAEGHAVDVVDDLSSGTLANLAAARADQAHELTFHQLDIRAGELVEMIARRRPEVIFHLAAQADVRVSVTRPVFDADVNILGTLRVLEGARAPTRPGSSSPPAGAPSTASPTRPTCPVRESHAAPALSPYGVSKKAAVDYLVAYRELHSVEFCALALANVYGPRQDPHGEAGVVAIFADRTSCARAGHHLRRRRADPGLHLRRRRRRRFRPGRQPRAAGSCSTSGPGQELSVNSWPRPWPRWPDRRWPRPTPRPGPASSSAAPSTRPGPASTWVGRLDRSLRRGPVGPRSRPPGRGRGLSAGARLSERGLRRRSGRSRRPPNRGAAMRVRPRTMATGSPEALPMTSSAAAAISSATQTSVACSSRPKASVVPRRSTTAATPAQPMATSVTP